MNKSSMDGLVARFLESYDAPAKDATWQQHSATFRHFWSDQVLAKGTNNISDDACDVVIRILDYTGKGNTRQSESVARTMVPQGVWRRLFNGLHTDQKLASLVDSSLKETDLERKINLLNELHAANERNKNRLTGESATVINALLAAYDPVNNLTVVSLNHRKTQMDFLQLKLSFDWDRASFGERIVKSNMLLREGTRALGLKGTARTLSIFWYYSPVMELWKPEDTVKRTDKGEVTVTVPQNFEAEKYDKPNDDDLRESLGVQATLAEIGAEMGFQIWLPRADRIGVLTRWKPNGAELLEHLPVGFDQATMKTIEQIDVLWIKKRSIVRAFEVEHTTSVYSGLLRMADLLAMQPNLKIKLHIVAPVSRRDKVLREIRRPVFMLLEGGALSDTCTYLSYETVADIRGQEHLKRLSDKVLDDYEERAQEID
jgi:hypothetical protein